MKISKAAQFCLVLATICKSSFALTTICEKERQLIDSNKNTGQISASIQIYPSRHAKDDLALTAHIRWPYPPKRLFTLVTAYDQFSRYMPRVVTSRILRRENHLAWVYQRLHLPIPMSDRHYVIRSDQQADTRRQHYTVDWELSPQALPANTGPALIPKQLRGCWDIRSTAMGTTDAIYWINLEPGGPLPAWLARTGMHHYLRELMQAIEQQLQRSGTD